MKCGPIQFTLFALASLVTAALGHVLAFPQTHGVTVAFVSGIYLAVLLLADQRAWMRWTAAALIVQIVAEVWFEPDLIPRALVDVVAHVAGTWIAAWLVRRVCGSPFRYDSPRNVFALAAFFAVPGGAISATVEVMMGATGSGATGTAGSPWIVYFTGYSLGGSIIAPLVLTALQDDYPWRRTSVLRWAEAIVLAITLTAVLHTVFSSAYPLIYLALLPMLWVALRFDMLAMALAMTLFAVMALQYTAMGLGPYATAVPTAGERALLVQSFLSIAAIAAFLLASVTRQRRMMLEELKRSREELETRVIQRTTALRENDERFRLARRQVEVELAKNQQRLIVSEARYRDLYVNNPLMYFTIDAAGIIASVNPQGAVQLGYRIDELVGRAVTMVFPADLHDQVRAQLNRCLEEPGRVHTWETTKVRKDGVLVWVRETATAAQSEDQTPLLLIMCEDITERRQAETALRESEQRLRTLLDAIPDHVRLKDTQGRYIMVNRAAQKSFRLPEHQIIGKTVFDLRPPEAAARIDAEDKLALAATDPVRIERQSFMEPGVWREEILAPIRNTDGAVTGMMSISRDITERKRAELDVLRESEERYRTLVEQASDVIYRTDVHGYFTYFNTDAVKRMAGYTREDLLGHHYLELVHPDYREQVEKFYRRQFQAKSNSSYLEFPAIAKDGSTIWVGQHVRAAIENNRVIYHQAVCRDISERVAAQQALRDSNDKLRRLSARQEELLEAERTRIAHDLHDGIGQSLNLVRIRIEDAFSNPGDAAFGTRMREIMKIIDHTSSAIRTLEFELSPPVLRELGLGPALRWLAGDMSRQYGLQVGVSDDDEPQPLDQLGRAILFRVIRELLINVVRHAKILHAHVDMQRAADTLIVTVSDEGAGFDAAGTVRGLGLESVRERLSYIGATITIDSALGEGTAVTLTVPLPAEIALAKAPDDILAFR